MSERRWRVLHRCGLDAPGQWWESDDESRPVPSDGMDAGEALALIQADYAEAGVSDAVARGSFGGSVEVLLVDSWAGRAWSAER